MSHGSSSALRLQNNKIATLRDRAHMLEHARSFFRERGVLEVDCPIISASASVDCHIDLIPALDAQGRQRYLHSSPEYAMKRLIADGIGDIYQLGHVFRQGEYGFKHNPEFMMAEWYRMGMPFDSLIEETLDFIRLFLGALPSTKITYREAFQRFAGLDYVHATPEELLEYIHAKNIPVYDGIISEGKDALLNIIIGTVIEPHLGQEGLCALTHYPATQAALAQKIWHGEEPCAERFEVYYRGIELANGFHELANAEEQRSRLIEANAQRIEMGKEPLPIDENFLSALEKGLPDCCGVAVGFDRLMMLRHQANTISDVIPFDWDLA